MDDLDREIKALRRYLVAHGRPLVEGSVSRAQRRFFASTVAERGPARIGEIGFNAGYSSWVFLRSSPSVSVVSFDLGSHRSVKAAQEYIERAFRGRHTLVLGDSKQTVPQYAADHPDVRFDLIFIDGGHDYGTARADMLNMRAFATAETLVVVDDLIPAMPYGRGPTKAWRDACAKGLIVQEAVYRSGKRTDRIPFVGRRIWGTGRYAV